MTSQDTFTGVTITKSANLPVAFDDVRRQLRLDDIAQDDELIQLYVSATCDQIERLYSVAMLTQTIVETHSQFPEVGDQAISLSIRPGLSITSIQYIDSIGATRTINPIAYRSYANSRSFVVMPAYGYEWPIDLTVQPDAVRITYTAGHGDTPATVPAAMRLAILNIVGKVDANREDMVQEKINASDVLLSPFFQFRS
jgi:uncharacterized phiE125 gp8 family phage protein